MPSSLGDRHDTFLNLAQVDQLITNGVDQALDQAESISMVEFEVLARLNNAAGHQLKMSEVATLLLASKSGTTRIVDRLETAGFVRRETPVHNRRVVHATITPAGVAKFKRAKQVFDKGVEDHFSQYLSDDELASLRRVLRTLLVGFGVWDDQRCSMNLEPATDIAASDPASHRSSTPN